MPALVVEGRRGLPAPPAEQVRRRRRLGACCGAAAASLAAAVLHVSRGGGGGGASGSSSNRAAPRTPAPWLGDADPQPQPESEPEPSGAAGSAVAHPSRREVWFPGVGRVALPSRTLGELRAAAEEEAKRISARLHDGTRLALLWYEVAMGSSGRSVRVEVDETSFDDLPAGALVHAGLRRGAVFERWQYGPQGDSRDLDTSELSAAQRAAGCPRERRPYHVVVTATAAVYEQWLCRVMYHWYKKAKARDTCGEMGGFTRLLTDRPDWLVKHIPTVQVPRLAQGAGCNKTGGGNTCDLGFVVLNRPNGFREWLKLIDAGRVAIKEKWVLLCEPDHFFLKPLPGIPRGGFAFNYMLASPNTPQHEEILPYIPPGFSPQQLPPGGPSPCLLHIDDWRKITPGWWENSFALRKNYRAEKAYGWVLEMWGFISAAVTADVDLKTDKWFQVEPCAVDGWNCIGKLHPTLTPEQWRANRTAGPFIAHITQAMDFQLTGEHGVPRDRSQREKDNPPWAWNKRHYSSAYPPKDLTPPPTAAKHVYAHLITEMVNDASASLPDWGRLESGEHKYGRDTCLTALRNAGKCDGFRSAHMMDTLGLAHGPAPDV
eukprot:TRINITY_DN14488_c0_g1_i1.p1 TRINITY_DN14488_c0_g1~~TRINITY_DN14488_c0_g1_i1.p1  ORF type:complete len:629 (+),score=177.73 TRINITY_DN14488_c0_g1_i1:82-1887(+)